MLEKGILTLREQEMSDRGDVLASETNWELEASMCCRRVLVST